MSNVSTSHNVVPFVSGKSEALTGQRLTVAKYKSTAKTPAKHPNVCASIPVLEITLESIPQNLVPHINTWLQEQQDNVFKSVYESHGGTLTSVNDAEIGVDSIIGYLSAVSVSGRLTKESIEQWYVSNCKHVIVFNAAVKQGFIGADFEGEELTVTEAQQVQLDKVSNAYRDLFGGLAGGATKYAENVQDSLSRMLSQCAESPMTERLAQRLEGMKVQKDYADIL